jgi:hypothetical protein
MALTRAQLADPNCRVTDSDYDAIESAIMETSRGRWFLFEYARRNCHANTELLLSAINSLKQELNSYRRNSSPYLVRTSISATLLTNQKESRGRPLRVLQPISNANGQNMDPNAGSGGVTAQNGNANNADLWKPLFRRDDLAAFEFNF